VSCCGPLTEWIKYRGTAVDGNDDDDVGGQVQPEHLQELEQLAGEVSGVPLDRHCPDNIRDVAEERDDEVRGGQIPDEQVDGGRAELASGAARLGTASVAHPTGNCDKNLRQGSSNLTCIKYSNSKYKYKYLRFKYKYSGCK